MSAHRRIHSRDRTLALAAVVALPLYAAVAIQGWRLFDGRDFLSFYNTADIWRRTGAYRPTVNSMTNLNLPHVAVLFAPLTVLSARSAWIVWQVVNLSCFGATVWLVRAWLNGPLLLLVMASPALLAAVGLAQVVGPLALCVTAAWMADREGRQRVAGVWLGFAVAAKPFMLPIVCWWILRRRWRAVGSALAVGAVVLGAGLLTLGSAPYREWAAAGSQMPWAEFPLNGSLFGALQRAGASDALWLAACALIALASAAVSWRADGDVGWALLIVAALLLSPVGWAYLRTAGPGPAARTPQDGPSDPVRVPPPVDSPRRRPARSQCRNGEFAGALERAGDHVPHRSVRRPTSDRSYGAAQLETKLRSRRRARFVPKRALSTDR